MQLSEWRDLAVVLLAFEAFILSLAPAALLYLCVRAMSQLLEQIRITAPKVRYFFRNATDVTERASQRIAAPFISTSAASAQVRRWWVALSGSHRLKKEV